MVWSFNFVGGHSCKPTNTGSHPNILTILAYHIEEHIYKNQWNAEAPSLVIHDFINQSINCRTSKAPNFSEEPSSGAH